MIRKECEKKRLEKDQKVVKRLMEMRVKWKDKKVKESKTKRKRSEKKRSEKKEENGNIRIESKNRKA